MSDQPTPDRAAAPAPLAREHLRTLIEDALGHAGAAVMQRAPSDDAIIAEHIESCRDILRKAFTLLNGMDDERRASARALFATVTLQALVKQWRDEATEGTDPSAVLILETCAAELEDTLADLAKAAA